MKRLILLSLITLLCLPITVYAASIGGAETQGQGKVAIGLDQEFIFDRDIKKKTITVGTNQTVIKGEIDKMYRTMVKASYGLIDGLDIYVKLGTADFESDMPYEYRDLATNESEIGKIKSKGDNAFAYGIGMKGVYKFENDWLIGCDLQYLRHKNDFTGTDSWTEYDAAGNPTGTYSDKVKGDVSFEEWQVAPYVAKKLGNFLPYFGVKYSDQRQKTKIGWESENYENPEKVKFKADDNFGVFLGTDYKIGENWKVNLEGRFVDETAISIGGTYRF